jgi:hypothetical protein
MFRSAFLIGIALAAATVACAKADEPKSPPPAPSSQATAITSEAGEADAAGALRALPMPQQFPRVMLDAATFDASRDAAKR